MKIKWTVVVVVTLVFAGSTSATILTSSGNWNVGSNWDTGVVPTSVDEVTISDGYSVTNNSSGSQSARLYVGSGGAGTLVVTSGDW